MVKDDNKEAYFNLFVFGYVVVSVLFLSTVLSTFFFIDFTKAPLVSLVLMIIGALIIVGGYITGGVFLWKLIKRKFSKRPIDWIIIILISLFIFVSLVVAALITKFSPQELSFNILDKMIQTSWIVFGVSITIYAVVIGFVSSSSTDKAKQMYSDFSTTLYPILCVLVPLVASTIMLYCFYEKCMHMTTNISYIAFIASVICSPYCLLLCIHFLSRITKDKIENKSN